jgi:putative methionine-R-sulfoxide reductase with GAF domain
MPVMVRSELSQFIRRQADARDLVTSLADAIGAAVSVEDSDGTVLHGAPLPASGVTRFPVRLADAGIGYVAGPERARAVALVLEHLLARSAEQKALGAEVLHLYREINLIYSFSEKLAALLDLDRVARLTLQEARQLIVATDGVIMLLDDETGELTSVANFGDEMCALPAFRPGQGIVGTIAATGIGEIVNDLDRDPRRVTEQTYLRALICAPLKIGEKVIGVLALGSTLPMSYTAAELKLLNTLALQTATAIENARLFERTVQAARERERLMALHQETEIARAKLDSEMKLAARIQHDLFPAQLPHADGYELSARNRPARRCGGDYYDALTLVGAEGDERLLLCVADVAGKGLPASLVMSNMQATLRALLGGFRSLPSLASQASDLLYNTTSAEKYVTAALAELAPASGAIRFVGAGHLDNVIVRRDGGVERLSSTGAPLGLLPPGLPYEQTDQVLHPGDALVLFSDGVTDAQNGSDLEFG